MVVINIATEHRLGDFAAPGTPQRQTVRREYRPVRTEPKNLEAHETGTRREGRRAGGGGKKKKRKKKTSKERNWQNPFHEVVVSDGW